MHVDKRVNGSIRVRASGCKYRCVAKYQMPLNGYINAGVMFAFANVRAESYRSGWFSDILDVIHG